MKFLLLTLITLSSLNLFANEKGNGGDICENRIKIIRNNISSWILKGGAEELELSQMGITLQAYKEKMLEKIKSTKISCPSEQVFIGKAEKTCKNFVDGKGTTRLVCNANRFNGIMSEEDEYRLIHHEYAGIAGLEVNQGEGPDYEESNYFISNQIAALIENELVKRLPIKNSDSFDDMSIGEIYSRGYMLEATVKSSLGITFRAGTIFTSAGWTTCYLTVKKKLRKNAILRQGRKVSFHLLNTDTVSNTMMLFALNEKNIMNIQTKTVNDGTRLSLREYKENCHMLNFKVVENTELDDI